MTLVHLRYVLINRSIPREVLFKFFKEIRCPKSCHVIFGALQGAVHAPSNVAPQHFISKEITLARNITISHTPCQASLYC